MAHSGSRSPNGRREDDWSKRSQSPRRRRSPDRKDTEISDQSGNCIYVGNLVRNIEENDIKSVFDEFGKIEKIEIVTDPSTKECRGFCFVTYVDPADAKAAESKTNGKELRGRNMKVEIAKRG